MLLPLLLHTSPTDTVPTAPDSSKDEVPVCCHHQVQELQQETQPTHMMMVSSAKIPLLALLVLSVSAQDTENDQVIGRLGLALSEGQAESKTECTKLVNRQSMGYTLNAQDLAKNCLLVPGISTDRYRLTLTTAGDTPKAYSFELLEVENSEFRRTPESWDETSLGMEYCAPGGSIIYFDNMAKEEGKALQVLAEWLPENTDDYCCVSQHMDWTWGEVRCPQTIGPDDPSVCWSTPHYFFKADGMEYVVARPDPTPDTVVTYASKDISNNCDSLEVGIGGKFLQPNNVATQTIAANFASSSSGERRCLFLEVSQYAGNLDYFYVSGAGVCQGGDDFEFFTAQEIGTNGANGPIESCLELTTLTMSNAKGSSMTFTNVQMEVFLPWDNDSASCGRTQSPSAVPTVMPSREPTGLPSVTPSIEPTGEPSVPPTAEPSTTPLPSLMPVEVTSGDDSGDDLTGDNLPVREPMTEPFSPTAEDDMGTEPSLEPSLPEPVDDNGDDTGDEEEDDMPAGKRGSQDVDDVSMNVEEEELLDAKKSKSSSDDEAPEPAPEPTAEPQVPRDPLMTVNDNGDEVVYVLDAEQAQNGGLRSEGVIGLICGMLILVLLLVNSCFGYHYLFKRNEDGTRDRRDRLKRGSMPKEDPVGTVVTVEELDGGMVMVKKVYPNTVGGNVVQKTVYPHQKAAARALKGYDYV